jgi:diguanylate cyclase (GGDEF)-like protein
MRQGKGIVHVTVSMGVTAVGSDRNASVEALLNEADIALYRAKENGRNRVEAHQMQDHSRKIIEV